MGGRGRSTGSRTGRSEGGTIRFCRPRSGACTRSGGDFVNVDGSLDCDIEPHWVVIGETYGAGRRRIAVFNRWVMTLDARGKYLRHLAQPVPWAPLALKWRCSRAEAQARFLLMGVAQRQALQEALRDEFEQAFLFCLALMHCENVDGGRAAAVAAGIRNGEAPRPGRASRRSATRP